MSDLYKLAEAYGRGLPKTCLENATALLDEVNETDDAGPFQALQVGTAAAYALTGILAQMLHGEAPNAE